MHTEADLTEAEAMSRRVEIVLGAIPTTDSSSSPSPSAKGGEPVSNIEGLKVSCDGG